MFPVCIGFGETFDISCLSKYILSLISSREKASLDNSIPPKIWYISRKVSGDFVCILSPKVKFWSVWIWDAVCDCIGVYEWWNFSLMFVFWGIVIEYLMWWYIGRIALFRLGLNIVSSSDELIVKNNIILSI